MSGTRNSDLLDQSIDRLGGYRELYKDLERESGYDYSIPSTVAQLNFEVALWDTVDELAELLLKKHNDYGPLNIAQSPGGPINGLRVRMWDKLARINNLYDNGKTAENESFEDSWKDLANYAIIGLLVLRGYWPTIEDND